jgi:2-methylisocitrate lyase-like PEP mutase family enzyme
VEDRLKPFDESVARVRAIVAAAEAEGVPFQLNARTDAIARGTGPLSDRLPEAIKRGKAFLDEGAAMVFIPGLMDRESVEHVVAALGRNTVSVIGLPGALTAAEYEDLGIARISYGPLVQRATLLSLQNLAKDLYGSGVIPLDLPALN